MLSLEKIEESIFELERADTCFSVCDKLADLYVVRDHLMQRQKAAAKVDVSGASEFLKTISDKNQTAVWAVMDDLMSDIKVLHPKMYDAVMQGLKKI